MLGKSALTKYLLYAFGEIALVVIGILIALQINNWNEERKTGLEEEKALEQLAEDISLEKAEFTNRSKIFSYRVWYLKKLAQEQYDSIKWEYFFPNLDHYWANERITSAYLGLKNSNKLYIIENEILRKKIIQHYEGNAAELNGASGQQIQFVRNHIQGYIVENLPPQIESHEEISLVKSELKKSQLQQLIKYQIAVDEGLIGLFKENIKFIDDILALIQLELGREQI